MTTFITVVCPNCGHQAEIMFAKNAIWYCAKCKTKTPIEKLMKQSKLQDFVTAKELMKSLM